MHGFGEGMFNVIAIMYIGEITIPNYKGNTSAAALIGSETSRALLGNYDKPTDRQTNGQTGSLGSYTSNNKEISSIRLINKHPKTFEVILIKSVCLE